MSSTIYSFFKLIQDNKIEIPIIQRDYAQGRDNAKALDVRKSMVTSMLNAVTKKNEPMFLDFVYGRIEERKGSSVFIPFDGQQRLTTLFLFHKYIADRTGNENCISNLGNFSYATRQSSREFCEEFVKRQCDFSNNEVVSVYIKKQPWFYVDWEKDPTIDGMLRTLDEIHSQVQKTSDCKFREIGELLTSKSCPITFHFMNMGEHELPDSTYIKMNVRGKTLTIFENFKASLEEYLDKNDKNLLKRFKGEYINREEPEKSIQTGIDGVWLDMFWDVKNKPTENKVIPDDLIMSFINRHLMNIWSAYFAKIDLPDNEYKEYEELNDKITTDLLFYPAIDDFISFEDIYEKIFDKCDIELCLNPLFNLWDELINKELRSEIANNCRAVWQRGENEKEEQKGSEEKRWDLFIGERNNVNRETYPSRIAFYALLLYFNGEKVQYSKESFAQWMRVVWNIIENQPIDNFDTYQSALGLINELSENSHNIYEWLRNLKNTITSGYAKEQIAEERAKTIQIKNGNPRSDGSTWEQTIIKAETTAFFKGAIRFMFTDENGKYDWDLFDDKFKNAVKYFDEKGVSVDYKGNSLLLRAFISYFDDWNMFWNMLYNNDKNNWKNILTNKIWLKPVSKLFSIQLITTTPVDFSKWESPLCNANFIQILVHEDMVKSELLSVICDKNCRLNWRYEKYALYPYNTKSRCNIFVVGDSRNGILSEWVNVAVDNNKIECNQKIQGIPYFWGWDIYFEYDRTKYNWNTDGKIYLLNDDDGRAVDDGNQYISVLSNLISAENIIYELDSLKDKK